jgi:hypothetical protein
MSLGGLVPPGDAFSLANPVNFESGPTREAVV